MVRKLKEPRRLRWGVGECASIESFRPSWLYRLLTFRAESLNMRPRGTGDRAEPETESLFLFVTNPRKFLLSASGT
jgi:hypothetical protein